MRVVIFVLLFIDALAGCHGYEWQRDLREEKAVFSHLGLDVNYCDFSTFDSRRKPNDHPSDFDTSVPALIVEDDNSDSFQSVAERLSFERLVKASEKIGSSSPPPPPHHHPPPSIGDNDDVYGDVGNDDHLKGHVDIMREGYDDPHVDDYLSIIAALARNATLESRHNATYFFDLGSSTTKSLGLDIKDPETLSSLISSKDEANGDSGGNDDEESKENDRSERFGTRPIVALGGTGTGTALHAHGEAWLHLLSGVKLWSFFPPGSKIGLEITELMEQAGSPAAPADWVLDDGPKGLKALLTNNKSNNNNNNNNVSQQSEKIVYFCAQPAGTTMYVPDRWIHGTMNIGGTVAIGAQASYGDEDFGYYQPGQAPGDDVLSMVDGNDVGDDVFLADGFRLDHLRSLGIDTEHIIFDHEGEDDDEEDDEGHERKQSEN